MSEPYDEIETDPWDEVVKRHETLLQDQLEYLGEASDFYRQKFEERGIDPHGVDSLESFRKLPFTVKDDQRRNQADPPPDQPLGAHQAVPTEALNRTISSSGTTGKPTYFGLTAADREHWNAVLRRCFHTAGIRPDDTVIFGAGQTMITGGTPYFEGLTELGANVVPAGGDTTERLLAATVDLDGDVMFTTTSHLRYLTERTPELRGHGVDDLPPTKLVGGGGPGIANPAIRAELADAWDAELVREIMGLGDVIGCMWAECEAQDGMHYHGQGHAHVELIDPENGDVIPFEAGAEGELVYTPLGREATPLLRYQSGDLVHITGTSCPCGRTAPKMEVRGRADDMLIYKGMNVFPTAIRDVASSVEGTLPYLRVVLPEPGRVSFEAPIPVRVVLDPGSDREPHAVADAVAEAVRAQLNVRIAPDPVDKADIELSAYKSDLVVVGDPYTGTNR